MCVRNAPGGGKQVETRVDQTDLEHALEDGARRVAEQETERDLTGTEPADGRRQLLRASVASRRARRRTSGEPARAVVDAADALVPAVVRVLPASWKP